MGPAMNADAASNRKIEPLAGRVARYRVPRSGMIPPSSSVSPMSANRLRKRPGRTDSLMGQADNTVNRPSEEIDLVSGNSAET